MPLDLGFLGLPSDPWFLGLPWNLGTLELWNPDTLGPWNPGTLDSSNPGSLEPWMIIDPGCLRYSILKPKNVRIPSHKAPQELSRRSFGSSFNFRSSVLDLEAYDILSQNQKTSECRATGRPRSPRDVHSVALLILGFRSWTWRHTIL